MYKHDDDGVYSSHFPGVEEGYELGDLDGVLEGAFDGIWEGIVDGALDGELVGRASASCSLGTSDGEREGDTEGTVDGGDEGFDDGTLEGASDGALEGVDDGVSEGIGGVEDAPLIHSFEHAWRQLLLSALVDFGPPPVVWTQSSMLSTLLLLALEVKQADTASSPTPHSWIHMTQAEHPVVFP